MLVGWEVELRSNRVTYREITDDQGRFFIAPAPPNSNFVTTGSPASGLYRSLVGQNDRKVEVGYLWSPRRPDGGIYRRRLA